MKVCTNEREQRTICQHHPAAAAKLLQSCLTLQPHRWQPMRLPIPGILQARTLEWVTISFFSAWKWKVKVKSLSCVWLLATPWTAAHQGPPTMGFSRQEYWSGWPLPSPRQLLMSVKKSLPQQVFKNKLDTALLIAVLFLKSALTTWMSICRWVDKEVVIHIHNGILFNVN